MGIYQRDLETFNESSVYENKTTNYNCVNCHSFCTQNPDEMLFHMRGQYGGTILIKNGELEKLNTKTDSTISSLVYPCWHPSGKYIAFSVNKINQAFYLNNRDRIEVFDSESDVVMYDIEKHEVFTSSLLFSKNKLETFPAFSPDGKILYFCSAKIFSVPDKSDSVKYSLCSVPFFTETQTIGEKVDTVFNARLTRKSASFPRISPDGRFLLFTVCEYGSFPIWHKEADLCLLDLKTKKYADMSGVNSQDVDSYHSWSSNSRWIVFSSRRVDGLYTRPYIAHIGKDGKAGKALILPQKYPDFYDAFMKSYNIPELVKGKVNADPYRITRQAKTEGETITFRQQR
jgi:Tol biopolymer transport system component